MSKSNVEGGPICDLVDGCMQSFVDELSRLQRDNNHLRGQYLNVSSQLQQAFGSLAGLSNLYEALAKRVTGDEAQSLQRDSMLHDAMITVNDTKNSLSDMGVLASNADFLAHSLVGGTLVLGFAFMVFYILMYKKIEPMLQAYDQTRKVDSARGNSDGAEALTAQRLSLLEEGRRRQSPNSYPQIDSIFRKGVLIEHADGSTELLTHKQAMEQYPWDYAGVVN